jgi:predicted DNA-binding transcriptional regulator AlpA
VTDLNPNVFDGDSAGGSMRLSLRPAEAAKALGIGARLLWTETNAGRIPHIRIGRAVVYPVSSLKQWLADQATKGVRE